MDTAIVGDATSRGWEPAPQYANGEYAMKRNSHVLYIPLHCGSKFCNLETEEQLEAALMASLIRNPDTNLDAVIRFRETVQCHMPGYPGQKVLPRARAWVRVVGRRRRKQLLKLLTRKNGDSTQFWVTWGYTEYYLHWNEEREPMILEPLQKDIDRGLGTREIPAGSWLPSPPKTPKNSPAERESSSKKRKGKTASAQRSPRTPTRTKKKTTRQAMATPASDPKPVSPEESEDVVVCGGDSSGAWREGSPELGEGLTPWRCAEA